jgi:hypothetical protein
MAITRIKSSNIEDGTVANVDIADLDATKLTGTVADARFPATLPASSGANLTALPAANLTGNIADARIPASAVTQHVTATDTSKIENDIAILALHQATNENKSAYSLANSWIEQFEDSTYVTGLTNCARITAGEYMATTYSISGQWTDDAYTELLIHSDTSNGSTTFTDSSHNSHAIQTHGTITHVTATKALGASSLGINGSNGLRIPSSTGMMTSTFKAGGDWTIEYWIKYPPGGTSGARVMGHWPSNNANQAFIRPKTTYSEGLFAIQWGTGNTSTNGTTSPETTATDAWVHVAIVQEGSYIKGFTGGTNIFNRARPSYAAPNDDWDIAWNDYPEGGVGSAGNEHMSAGNLDEIRISSTARYSGTTTFTPQADSSANNATGSFTSTTVAPQDGVAKTKVGLVLLYKNNAGTNALNAGNDLFCSVSADNGSNYTPVVLAAKGTFSTGILIAVAPAVTVTSGTQLKYKVEFANQASGSKEARVHGVAMTY